MKKFTAYCVMSVAILALISGCQKQNPVQLHDDDIQAQEIEILNRPVTVEAFDVSTADIGGFFLTSEEKFYGRFNIASAEYDGPSEHREASLAQAVFFNRAEPVIFNGDTLGYRTIGAGVVSVDNLSLREEPVRLNLPGVPMDTIGLRYALLNIDGIGGKGFQYFGKHEYRWNISGSASLPAFQVNIDAPEKVHVHAPAAGENLSRTRNVPMKWRGGGEIVTILIGDFQEGLQARPILRLRIKNNKGRLLLPKRILQLLPENRSRFLFTFSSESSFVMRPDSGYQENIVVRAVTSHSLVYYLN